MSVDAATNHTPPKAPGPRKRSPAEAFYAFGRRARPAGVLLLGCLLLGSLLVAQVGALELSDRLGIFPLYGFFFVNLLCGLLLSGSIYVSRKYSSCPSEASAWASSASPLRPTNLRVGRFGVPNSRGAAAVTPPPPKPVAVLLIIRRQGVDEPNRTARVSSA